ncbi:MAG: enoyl-CoA hydratase-related protein [Dehalococcoidales bacterium]|jgi:enoyl-CoA hydratase|nr:enoyl-CoA hydratase-related protein [Dehalococcoidales bacterium]
MSNKAVLYEKRGHAGFIILNRPETGNRFNLEMAQDLSAICEEINHDPDIYLAVLTGSGKAFCLGGDERELIPAGEIASSGQGPAEAVAGLGCPAIAAINGEAIGVGLELALACDLRVASTSARLGLPQISSGLIPLNGGTQRLSRIAGRGKALEMILTGEIVDARTAYEIGLVNRVVEQEAFAAELDSLVNTLTAKAPLAMRYCKEAVIKGLDLTLEQGLRLEADLYFLLHTTRDRTEGIRSFLEKRTPGYEGR